MTGTYDALVDRCHLAALEALQPGPDDAVRDELVHARLQLAAVGAELERLQHRPEVKLGEALRRARQRFRPDDATDATATPDGAADPDATAAPDGAAETDFGVSGFAWPGGAAPSAVVVVRNRRWALGALVELLERSRVVSIDLADIDSTDPVTVELLRTSELPVRRLDASIGADDVWTSGLMARHLAAGPTLLIGGDTVVAPGCPTDVVARLATELVRRRDADAVAVAGDGSETGSSRRPFFVLVRAGATRRPRAVVTLPAPYACRIAEPDGGGQAPERFATHHDDERFQLSLPDVASR